MEVLTTIKYEVGLCFPLSQQWFWPQNSPMEVTFAWSLFLCVESWTLTLTEAQTCRALCIALGSSVQQVCHQPNQKMLLLFSKEVREAELEQVGVIPRVLKPSAEQLSEILWHLIKLSLTQEKAQLWKTSCFGPVPKKTHPSIINDYELLLIDMELELMAQQTHCHLDSEGHILWLLQCI